MPTKAMGLNGYSTDSLAKFLVKICHFPACIAIIEDVTKLGVNGDLCSTNVSIVNIC